MLLQENEEPLTFSVSDGRWFPKSSRSAPISHRVLSKSLFIYPVIEFSKRSQKDAILITAQDLLAGRRETSGKKCINELSLKEGRLTMSWIFLGIAILLETTGTTCMKLSEGFSKLVPSVLLFIFYGLSFALLTVVMKRINLSIAYAIWSGAGTALIATVGVVWFKEPVTAVKIVSLVLIIAGVVGLRLTGGE